MRTAPGNHRHTCTTSRTCSSAVHIPGISRAWSTSFCSWRRRPEQKPGTRIPRKVTAGAHQALQSRQSRRRRHASNCTSKPPLMTWTKGCRLVSNYLNPGPGKGTGGFLRHRQARARKPQVGGRDERFADPRFELHLSSHGLRPVTNNPAEHADHVHSKA